MKINLTNNQIKFIWYKEYHSIDILYKNVDLYRYKRLWYVSYNDGTLLDDDVKYAQSNDIPTKITVYLWQIDESVLFQYSNDFFELIKLLEKNYNIKVFLHWNNLAFKKEYYDNQFNQ